MSSYDFSRFHGRLEISGHLTLKTPLRIGTGGGDEMGLADIAVVKDSLGRPYIPGSSFKGVLRAYVESILRTINTGLACLCVTEEEDHFCPTTKRRRKKEGEEVSPYEALLNEEFGGDEERMYLEGTCRACQVFGSLGMAAKVQVPDLTLVGEWFGRYQVRYGVSIDRDTETAVDGRLYTGEAVPAGTVFKCEIILENASEADQGLVLLGLKAFERELVTLGGASSRGLGQVQLRIDSCQEIRAEPADLIEYLSGGSGRDVDEAARNQKIASLQADLAEWRADHA